MPRNIPQTIPHKIPLKLLLQKGMVTLLILLFVAAVLSAQQAITVPLDDLEESERIDLAKDTLLRNMLLEINLDKYLGKTVAAFVQNDTLKQFKSYSFNASRPFTTNVIELQYANGLTLEVENNKNRFKTVKVITLAIYMNDTIKNILLKRDKFESYVKRDMEKK